MKYRLGAGFAEDGKARYLEPVPDRSAASEEREMKMAATISGWIVGVTVREETFMSTKCVLENACKVNACNWFSRCQGESVRARN
jgi:hypothetical protein